jgi:hypothetical protein
MSILKTGTILAVALTFAGAAPAFAHKQGGEWLVMMERLQQQAGASQAYAQEPRGLQAVPQVNKTQPGWRYRGGPKGTVYFGN